MLRLLCLVCCVFAAASSEAAQGWTRVSGAGWSVAYPSDWQLNKIADAQFWAISRDQKGVVGAVVTPRFLVEDPHELAHAMARTKGMQRRSVRPIRLGAGLSGRLSTFTGIDAGIRVDTRMVTALGPAYGVMLVCQTADKRHRPVCEPFFRSFR